MTKNSVVWFGKLLLKSNVITISFLAGIFMVVFFFIDAYTPDVTEIKTEGSLTIENSARFYVDNALKVKTLDGRSEKLKPKFTASAIVVLLSPGTHTFTMDFKISDGDTEWSAKDLKIGTDFKAGKYYRFNYSLDKGTKNISYSIKEADPVTYKEGFVPKYIYLLFAAVAFAITFIFVKIAQKKGTVYNITDD